MPAAESDPEVQSIVLKQGRPSGNATFADRQDRSHLVAQPSTCAGFVLYLHTGTGAFHHYQQWLGGLIADDERLAIQMCMEVVISMSDTERACNRCTVAVVTIPKLSASMTGARHE